MAYKKLISFPEILHIFDEIKITSNRLLSVKIEKQAEQLALTEFTVFNYPKEAYEPQRLKNNARYRTDAIKENRVLFAYKEDRIIGFAELITDKPKIRYIGVLSEYRKEGIGSLIMDAALEWFARKGIYYFSIHSVFNSEKFYDEYFSETPSIILGEKEFIIFIEKTPDDKKGPMYYISLFEKQSLSNPIFTQNDNHK